MIQYEDDCVGCPPEIGCLGNSCPKRNVPHTYCDKCGDEAKLYQFDDKEICEKCFGQEMITVFNDLSFEDKLNLMKGVI